MSGGVVVAIFVTLFFVIGITVGIITVIALSALRQDRRGPRRLGRPRSGPGSLVSSRSGLDALDGPEGDMDDDIDIDDQAPQVSGVPGHWDGSIEDGTIEKRGLPWWRDDTESNSLG
jgi:hypothetical protein